VGVWTPEIQSNVVDLPAPLGPDQPGERARLDVEARVVDRGQSAELLAEVLDPEGTAGRRLAGRALDVGFGIGIELVDVLRAALALDHVSGVGSGPYVGVAHSSSPPWLPGASVATGGPPSVRVEPVASPSDTLRRERSTAAAVSLR